MLQREGVSSLDDFRIFETEQFQKDIKQDFSGQQERIKRKLRSYVYSQLRQNPYFGKNIKKPTHYQPETWRYRIGPWRFFYEIDSQKKIIFMTVADSRQEAY